MRNVLTLLAAIGTFSLLSAGCREDAPPKPPTEPERETNLPGDSNSGSTGPVTVRHFKHGNEQKIPVDRTDEIVSAAEALFASCSDRSRRLVLEENWTKLLSGDCLLIAYTPPKSLDTKAKAGIQVGALLVPLDGAGGWGESILARDAERIQAPFTQYDTVLLEKLKTHL